MCVWRCSRRARWQNVERKIYIIASLYRKLLYIVGAPPKLLYMLARALAPGRRTVSECRDMQPARRPIRSTLVRYFVCASINIECVCVCVPRQMCTFTRSTDDKSLRPVVSAITSHEARARSRAHSVVPYTGGFGGGLVG